MYCGLTVACLSHVVHSTEPFSFCWIQKETLLIRASRSGYKSICKVLLEKGAKVNLADAVSRDCGNSLRLHDKRSKIGAYLTGCVALTTGGHPFPFNMLSWSHNISCLFLSIVTRPFLHVDIN